MQARTFVVDSIRAFVRPTDRYVEMLRSIATPHDLPYEALAMRSTARDQHPQGPAPTI